MVSEEDSFDDFDEEDFDDEFDDDFEEELDDEYELADLEEVTDDDLVDDDEGLDEFGGDFVDEDEEVEPVEGEGQEAGKAKKEATKRIRTKKIDGCRPPAAPMPPTRRWPDRLAGIPPR
jgi:hypothetical protein